MYIRDELLPFFADESAAGDRINPSCAAGRRACALLPAVAAAEPA